MPLINKNYHYKELALKPIMMDKKPFDIDALAQDIATHSGSSLREILTALKGHAYKEHLIDALQHIHFAFEQDSLSKNNKAMMASKLTEELNSCTPGFENRVNDILLSLHRPTTIDEFLERIRRDIVEVIARKTTDGVHQHNRFFTYSAKNYGVRSINPDDIYAANPLSEDIVFSLEEAFNAKYTFATILVNLPNYIRSELENYFGYSGYAQAGYMNGIYQPILTFFKQITHLEISHDDAFIIDDEKITDINWPSIEKMLFKYLMQDNYVELTELERRFFEVLENEDTNPLTEFLNNDENHKLLRQSTLLHHLLLFTGYPENNIKLLINTLLFCYDDELTPKELLNIINILKTLDSERNAIERVMFWLAEKPLSTQLQANYLFYLLENNETNQLQYVLTFIQNNQTPEQINALFSSKDNNGHTALMLAARYQPEAVANILNAVQTLPEKEQITILAEKNNNGQTALMFAARYQPEALANIIKAVQTLPEKAQIRILAEKDKAGHTALMAAVVYQPKALANIIKAVQTLAEETQITILAQKNNIGDTALMFAAQHQPEALANIIKAVQTLSKEVQRSILAEKNNNGQTALILAAQYQPEALANIIKALQTLPEEAQITILAEKGKYGDTALILAAEYQPEALANIIKAVQTLPEEAQIRILAEKDKEGHTALMVAAVYQPEALANIIKALQTLPEEAQITILAEKNNDGDTALMFAAELQPEALANIIKAVQTLPEKAQISILAEKNNNGHTALMFAAKHQPEALTNIIKAVQTLPEDTQLSIWSTKNRFGSSAFALMMATNNSVALNAIQKLSFHSQAQLLSKQQFHASLKHEITSLNDEGLESHLKQCLQAMSYNKTDKQVAVLTALREIKKTHGDDSDAGIKEALDDKKSALYLALNIKRYPFRFFTSAHTETGSFLKMKNEAANYVSIKP